MFTALYLLGILIFLVVGSWLGRHQDIKPDP